MNETMTHECFSVNVLLIPRISRQLVASENQKSVQNSRHIGRVAHDSNKKDWPLVKLNPSGKGHAIFARALMYFHYHTVGTKFDGSVVTSSTLDFAKSKSTSTRDMLDNMQCL